MAILLESMTSSQDKTRNELKVIRDTVESVWIAVVVALILRAFMVEGFVIPTGSMAPRLLGEHWHLTCPACGYEFDYGVMQAQPGQRPMDYATPQTPTGAVCPNCEYSYPYTLQPDYPRGGDRVLVMKYLYNFQSPQPWDVVVFRNPQDNREHFIKRLIGLPGESIEIVHGNVFVREGEDGPWRVRRKPEKIQEALWQIVHDNDLPPEKSLRERDRSRPNAAHWIAGEGWTASEYGRNFQFDGNREASSLEFRAPRDTFLPNYGYNPDLVRATSVNTNRDIISDLNLSLVFIPDAPDAKVELALSSFEHQFRASLSADGVAELFYRPDEDQEWTLWSRKQIDPLQEGQCYPLSLAHVDFRVEFRLDGQLILESTGQQYADDYDALKRRMNSIDQAEEKNGMYYYRPIPTPRISISASGGAARVRHLKLQRDVYYTCPSIRGLGGSSSQEPNEKYARELEVKNGQPGWGTTDNPIVLRKFKENPMWDEFFMMGDNSPASHDGRSWFYASPTLQLHDESGNPLYQIGTVPRYNLVGKAFCVYWTGGYRIPGLPRFPLIPNVGQMRLIR